MTTTPTVAELTDVISAATTMHRHVHAAQHPCEGCAERAARAVVDFLDARARQTRTAPTPVRISIAQTLAGDWYRVTRIDDGLIEATGFETEAEARAFCDENNCRVVAAPAPHQETP